MSDTLKQPYWIYRYLLLRDWNNGSQVSGKNDWQITDACAYVWCYGVYPIFDASLIDEDFENLFDVSEEHVSQVAEFIDNAILEVEQKKRDGYPTYYEIQSACGGKSANLNLSCVLRYIFLSKKFDNPDLWKSVVSQENSPVGSEFIIKEFSADEIKMFIA